MSTTTRAVAPKGLALLKNDVFSTGDKVMIQAISGRDAEYNGRSGEVRSELRVSPSMVANPRAFYPPDVVYANSEKRYYLVSLLEHDLTICGEYLTLIERAPVAGGAPGAP